MDTTGEGSSTGPSGVSHTGPLPGSTPPAPTVADPVRAMRPTAVRSRAAESQVKRMILGTTKQDDPEWMLVHHSQYGVINRGGGKYLEPAGLHACELAADTTDPHALTYDIPISPNQYDILQDEGFDETLPPDVDIEAKYIDDNEMSEFVSGYTVESDLLPLAEEVRSLKDVRKLPLTVEQVSVEELQNELMSSWNERY
ncbi:hypothetical protein P3T76_016158 [Phytophthora citrophthora]|uniref:Uncharacterized protein n=1 Tax=Phytophthora citrophthora TaxID=4793 RepID=A0AAD9FY10_9STRA|nr:hypothetical protein P3T76_016158 [Phytophthora citrophthora]